VGLNPSRRHSMRRASRCCHLSLCRSARRLLRHFESGRGSCVVDMLVPPRWILPAAVDRGRRIARWNEAMRSDRWSSVAGVMTGLLAPIVGLGGIVGELGSMLGDIARIPPDPPACEPSGSSPPLVLNERGARERFFICRRCWAGEICAREG